MIETFLITMVLVLVYLFICGFRNQLMYKHIKELNTEFFDFFL